MSQSLSSKPRRTKCNPTKWSSRRHETADVMATKDITDEQIVRAALEHSKRPILLLDREGRAREMWDVADLLMCETGQPYKVCIRAIERCASRGYVDWGVVVNRPFPTREGLDLIGVPRPKPPTPWHQQPEWLQACHEATKAK